MAPNELPVRVTFSVVIDTEAFAEHWTKAGGKEELDKARMREEVRVLATNLTRVAFRTAGLLYEESA